MAAFRAGAKSRFKMSLKYSVMPERKEMLKNIYIERDDHVI